MSAAAKQLEISAHEQAVLATIGAAYRKHGANTLAVDPAHSLTALHGDEGEPDSVEEFVRVQTFRKYNAYVFEEGPDPATTMRRLYTIVKAYSPELLFNMSDAELGLIFAETRAAQSWRRDKLVTKKLKEAGALGARVRCQKTETACKKYADAQVGNRNRARKKQPVAA